MNTEELQKNIDMQVDKSAFYYKLYQRAKEFDSDRFDGYTETLAYYEMKEKELKANKTNKPWVLDISTPYAANAINKRVSSLISNDYIGELEPLSPDDVEDIENLNNIYHMFWNEMNMDKHISTSILYSSILREAYTHIILDTKPVGGTNRKNNGSLKAYFIDPSSVLIDPNALNFKDADYIVITERISKDQYNREYKQKIDDLYNSAFQPEDRGEIYVGNDYDTNQENVLTKLTFYIKDEEKLGVINKVIMIEKKVVEEKELPISVFPIGQLRWEKRIKSPYGISLMDRLLPLQKSINAIESAGTTAALAFSSPSYAVRRGSGVDPRKVAALAGAPGAVFVVDGNPRDAIVPISNGKVDSELIKMKQDNRNELEKLSGLSQEFMGTFGTAGNTKTGAQESSMRSRIIEQMFLANLEEYVEDLTKIIVEFITKGFSGEMLYSRGKKQSTGNWDFKEYYVDEKLKDLEYNFYINMDIKTPYSKERTKALMQELYQIERQYDAPIKTISILDIIKEYNVPNSEELVERYKQLAIKDTKVKADTITQWVVTAENFGIDAGTISQGILEIIEGKQTPTIDNIIKQIEMQQRQQEQQDVLQQQKLASIQGNLEKQKILDAQKQQQNKQKLTGNEKF